jgi:hypothetical protein
MEWGQGKQAADDNGDDSGVYYLMASPAHMHVVVLSRNIVKVVVTSMNSLKTCRNRVEVFWCLYDSHFTTIPVGGMRRPLPRLVSITSFQRS